MPVKCQQDRRPLFLEIPENPDICKLFKAYAEQHLDKEAVDASAVLSRLVLQARLHVGEIMSEFACMQHARMHAYFFPVQMQEDVRKGINQQVKDAQAELTEQVEEKLKRAAGRGRGKGRGRGRGKKPANEAPQARNIRCSVHRKSTSKHFFCGRTSHRTIHLSLRKRQPILFQNHVLDVC